MNTAPLAVARSSLDAFAVIAQQKGYTEFIMCGAVVVVSLGIFSIACLDVSNIFVS